MQHFKQLSWWFISITWINGKKKVRVRRMYDKTGCEIINCPWFKNGICTEPYDYVDRDTGEDMCSRNLYAIPREEFESRDKMSCGETVKTINCHECKYSVFSKTVEYAYTCKNRMSPCRNRLVYSDFYCAYGQKKEVKQRG